MPSPAGSLPGPTRTTRPERSLPPLPTESSPNGSSRSQHIQNAAFADMQAIITNGFSGMPPSPTSPLTPLARKQRSLPRVLVSRMAGRGIEEEADGAEGGKVEGPPKIELNGRGSAESKTGHGLLGAGLAHPEMTDATAQTTVTDHTGGSSNGSDGSTLAVIEHTPTAWGANFWVVLADPVTNTTFYACPSTGDTSWEPPTGVFVLPRRADGEWWELSDKQRAGRSYFYHTLSGKTQWTRPTDDLVIPLGMIQLNTAQNLSADSSANASTVSVAPAAGGRNRSRTVTGTAPSNGQDTARRRRRSDNHLSRDVAGWPIAQVPVTPARTARSAASADTLVLPPKTPPKETKPRRSKGNGRAFPRWAYPSPPADDDAASPKSTIAKKQNGTSRGKKSHAPSPSFEGAMSNEAGSESSLPSPRQRFSFGPLNPQRKLEVHSGNLPNANSGPASPLSPASPTASFRLQVSAGDGKKSLGPSKLSKRKLSRLASVPSETELSFSASPSDSNAAGNLSAATIDVATSLRPIRVELPLKTKRLSTGLHPLLPSGISEDIHAFRHEDYASRYFATQRRGFMRRIVPLQIVVEWQKNAISAPLLTTTRSPAKDAIRAFKIIQHVMGDRDKPVEGIVNVPISSAANALISYDAADTSADKAHLWLHTEKRWVLEEERWLLQLGITCVDMRDEIYVQCVKQLTNNPNGESVRSGFQLLCVLVITFGPTLEAAEWVRVFLKRRLEEQDAALATMASYCLQKLEVIRQKGARQRALMFGEIEQASQAAFGMSVFGQTLQATMQAYENTHPTAEIPYVVTFLAEGILALKGQEAEGIFRIPGDGDTVSELKARLDRGQYQLVGIDDPHVPASLLKLWLRELQDPLIPDAMYNQALDCSQDPGRTCDFVLDLPPINRRIVLYLVAFLQLFLVASVENRTKMTASNLALVFAPNILRTTAKELQTIYTNSTFEARFVLNLLRHLKPAECDQDYRPEPPRIPSFIRDSFISGSSLSGPSK